jgi:Icc-related predicted phosphoesterase
MKFDLVSDLHDDYNKTKGFPYEPNEGSEILVVAGDWMERQSFRNSKYQALREAQLMYKHVVVIAGNHEFYGANYQATVNEFREVMNGMEGVHFLHGDKWDVPFTDILFMGGTLFTDMNGDDPLTKARMKQYMADFTYITYGGPIITPAIKSSAWDMSDGGFLDAPSTYGDRKIVTPDDYVREWRAMTKYFEDTADENPDKKIVLVTHHAMSEKSVMPRFMIQYLENGGYRTRMEWFFEKHKNVHVHCHGHMHDFIRYEHANTRVYCNPFGYYRHEPKPNYGPLQIEV